MAHNIYEGRAMIVRSAWHNEGVRVDAVQSSAEAIKLARLDYQIEKHPVYVEFGGQKISSEFLATVNTANKKVLGIVKDRYQIIQNTDAFKFFDEVVKTGDAIYESVGALGDGERIWILAKLPTNLLIFKDIDIVENYLLLTNTHDGKSSLTMYYTPIRVVCQNTLNQSVGNKVGESVNIRHIGDIKGKVDEAKRILGLGLDFAKEFERKAKELVNIKFTNDRAERYFDKVLRITDVEESSTRVLNVKESIKGLYKHGKGTEIEGIQDTAWTAYNAVTEYADHYKTVKNNRRLESIVFGSGADLKHRAWAEVLTEAEVK
jgi:phage/plasmid-like protein (TIGR03299 family)